MQEVPCVHNGDFEVRATWKHLRNGCFTYVFPKRVLPRLVVRSDSTRGTEWSRRKNGVPNESARMGLTTVPLPAPTSGQD